METDPCSVQAGLYCPVPMVRVGVTPRPIVYSQQQFYQRVRPSLIMKRIVYLQGQQEDPLVHHIDFPTGEKHIRIEGLRPEDEVYLIYNDPGMDVMKLCMAVDICNRANVRDIIVIMPLVPYSRQDQVYLEGDPLSIKVFAAIINDLNTSQVVISDPHSKVTEALIDNVKVVPQRDIAMAAFMDLRHRSNHPVAIVAPDLGAAKKVKDLVEHIWKLHGFTVPVIQCDKIRDPLTGQIDGFRILSGWPKGFHCLMVDDICDGGGTFLGLHGLIKGEGAIGQSLYVTHGIFSKGVDLLRDTFDTIYTSDSFPTMYDKIIQIKGNLYPS